MTVVRRVARPMLASIFIVGGLDALRHPSSKVPAAKPFIDKVAEPLRLPNDPELLVRANGGAMVGGGLLLALGKLPRLASAVLIGTVVPTSIAGHPFWREQDADKRKQQRTHFLKNLGLLGGLLLAAVDTEGKPGLAYRAKLAGHSVERGAKLTRRQGRHAAKAARREAKLAGAQARNALS